MTTPTAQPLPQDYQDILQILPRLPEPDLGAATKALAGTADLPPETREHRGWLARCQGRGQPRAAHPRLALFAANHGVARLAPPQTPLVAQLPELVDPNGALAQQVAAVDADFRLYEMNLAEPGADFTQGQPALSDKVCVQAMAYGMMAVDMGLDVLALAAMGDGQALAAAALIAALTGTSVADVLAATGAEPSHAETLQPQIDLAAGQPPLVLLARFGGAALAALTGAMMAARMAHTPVVIHEAGGLAALTVLHRLEARAARHVALAGGISAPWLGTDWLRLPTASRGFHHAGLAGIQCLQAAAAADPLAVRRA